MKAFVGTRVRLNHNLFAKHFRDPVFRKTEADLVPAVAFSLADQAGGKGAVIPIEALLNELKLESSDPDYIMLKKIAEALEFVVALRIGDPLPAEVLTGAASWDPELEHIHSARARIRFQIVTWADGAEVVETHPDRLAQIAEDPGLEARYLSAIDKVMAQIGIGREETLAIVEFMTAELALIEALRDWLFRGQTMMLEKIQSMVRGYKGDRANSETLSQVQRLAEKGVKSTRETIEELDAQTSEIIIAFRNIDAVREFIRKNRDYLYRVWRAWRELIAQWREVDGTRTEGRWILLRKTYQFLAPRYMSVQEWTNFRREQAGESGQWGSRMSWF